MAPVRQPERGTREMEIGRVGRGPSTRRRKTVEDVRGTG